MEGNGDGEDENVQREHDSILLALFTDSNMASASTAFESSS